jgi:tetratricopeptide (TPR) repeat protein
MSDNSNTWKWVDEDPIEKLLKPSSAPPAPAAPTRPGADSLMGQGRAQFERMRFEEAAGSYSAAAAAEPGHPTVHFDLAVCIEKLEHWKPAASSFQRALEIDPGRAQALIGLGACLLHLDGAETALDCFEQCLEQSARTGAEREAALFGKAVALQMLNCNAEAEAVYSELLEIDPTAAEPRANLIALSAARGDIDKLAEHSKHLLAINPRSKAALQGLATLAIQNGDQAAALDYCTRLVEVDPDAFEPRFNLRFVQQSMAAPRKRAARSIA